MSGPEDLEGRLRAAQAERAALATQREDRAKQKALEAKVVAEEMALRDEKAIESAEQEHGKIGDKIQVVHTDRGCIIVKRPSAVLFRRFQDVGSVKVIDLEKLVRPCLVYPDATAFDTILDELPATLTRVADAVVELAGARSKEVSGK